MPNEMNDPAQRSWDEYLAICLRRRWWMLLPLFICWATVWGIGWLLPTTYQSEALILVEQQAVPDKFVTPNVNLNLQDRVQSITQEVLSRTRLQATIDRFHLYSRSRGLSALLKSGDPIEQMRNDIKIDLVESPGHPGDFSAFKIRYSAGSPQLAQRVNSELTSLFVEENVRTDRRLSENTTAFLGNQLADARAKMEEQEAKVAAFKAKHVGDLPTQLESNFEILNGLQSQLQNSQHAVDAAKQQKIYLESLLQQYRSTQATTSSDGSTVNSPEALEKDILDMRVQLQNLRSRYTNDHPDIIALNNKIARAEELKMQAEKDAASGQSSVKSAAATDASQDGLHESSTAMMQLQSQLKANQVEIQNEERHEKDLESQISTYQARLNMTPEVEQELTNVSRGYEESKSNYDSLLQKQMQSQLATSLEQREQGEQFLIMDAPSLPEKPSAPNHFRLSLIGLALGIGLGLGLAVLLELTDVRIRREKDLEGLVRARVLVGIPRLGTPEEDRLRTFNQKMEVGAAAAIFVLVLLGNLYALYKG